MRGTIIFQLAPGELVALRIRDTSTVQLAPGELGRCIITFQRVSSKLVNVENYFKIKDFLYLLATKPFVCRQNALM
ncbi:hypothetical protein CsSME_00031789 [Camellia sinensis var. sinensis]